MKKGVSHVLTMAVIVLFVFLAIGSGSTPVVREISYETNTLQNVQRVTEDKLRKDWLAISPDSSKLLYCESTETKLDKWLWADDFRVVYLKNIAVPAKTPLISDSSFAPAWFDDNKTFAYVGFEGGSNKIMRSSITGGGKTYITRNAIGSGDANPNVFGKTLLCDTFINGKRQLVRVQTDGTEVTILGEGSAPSWHPSGEKFVFIRNGKIFEMELSTNQVTELFSDPQFGCDSPSFSKDGKYILFSMGSDEQIRANVDQKEYDKKGKMINKKSTQSKKDVTRWHLFLISANGMNRTQITVGDNSEFSPKVTKDNEVYYISNAGGSTEIWKAKLNLEGLGLEEVSSDSADE